MSPEQIEACNPAHEREPKELDGRSDLFALAVVLWELLFGERPFQDDDMDAGWTAMLTAMAKRRRSEQPKAVAGTKDAVAVRLEHVLRKVLSPEPAARPADGAAMARELMLCLNPRAWDLVNDLKSGWRDFARRHPFVALFPVNLPIFILAGLANLWYNYYYYLPELEGLFESPTKERVHNAFMLSAWTVNSVLYSLGIFLVLYWASPVARAIGRLNRGETLEPEAAIRARRRAIVLGHGVAAVGMGLWLVAGFVFPAFIRFASGASIPSSGIVNFFLHFFMSMVACGIISCCLPFLATTWLSVRVYIPALLSASPPELSEQLRLVELGRQSGYYLFISPVAPLMAMLLVMISVPPEMAQLPITVLVVVAIAGFFAAYGTWQRIRTDLDSLAIVSRPADMIGTATDTSESSSSIRVPGRN
jgi:hypothetical protein